MADERTPDGDAGRPSDGDAGRPSEETSDTPSSDERGGAPDETGDATSPAAEEPASGDEESPAAEEPAPDTDAGASGDEGSPGGAPTGSRGGGTVASLADSFGMGRRPFAALLAVVAVGLVARLLWLGARPMHFDEARVAYWGLRGARTGVWQYRPVVHGPLVQHFNRLLFPVLGPGDVAARLPVALFGSLLPLSALLFRDHLRDYEVTALGALLAFNPLLLYYSRFMRSDLLVAGFALVALGALVRLYETRRVGYGYAAAASYGLAFASKENAVVYLLCWFGMFGLVAGLELLDPRRVGSRRELFERLPVVRGAWVDAVTAVAGGVRTLAGAAGADLARLVGGGSSDGTGADGDQRRPASADEGSALGSELSSLGRWLREDLGGVVTSAVEARYVATLRATRRYGSPVAIHGTGAVLLFALVTVFLFARRAPPGQGVGLYHSAPTTTVRYVVGDIVCGLEFWTPIHAIPVPKVLLPKELYAQTCTGFPSNEGPLADYGRDMGRQLQVLGKTSVSLLALALVGVVSEFRSERPRVLVPAALYWGVASLVGYPVGADITYPAWVAIHAVVPLAIPAAAGAVSIGEWTVEELRVGNDVSAGALAAAALLVVGTTAGVAVHHSYVEPTGQKWSSDAQMVQYAQPEQPMDAAVDATRRASRGSDGVDIVVYGDGEKFSLVDMGPPGQNGVGCMRFFQALPLSYYFHAFDAEVTCSDNGSTLASSLASDPPVVVSRDRSAPVVRDRLPDRYVERRYDLRQGGREVVFFFDPRSVEVPPPNPRKQSTGGSSVR